MNDGVKWHRCVTRGVAAPGRRRRRKQNGAQMMTMQTSYGPPGYGAERKGGGGRRFWDHFQAERFVSAENSHREIHVRTRRPIGRWLR